MNDCCGRILSKMNRRVDLMPTEPRTLWIVTVYDPDFDRTFHSSPVVGFQILSETGEIDYLTMLEPQVSRLLRGDAVLTVSRSNGDYWWSFV